MSSSEWVLRAAQVQAIERGKRARRQQKAEHASATKVQAIQRGKAARKGAQPQGFVGDIDESSLDGYLGLHSHFYMTASGEVEEREAASKIQAVHRGKAARKGDRPRSPSTAGDVDTVWDIEPQGFAGDIDESSLDGYLGLHSHFYMTASGEVEEREAASKIQAVHRGKTARKAGPKDAEDAEAA
jgi:hypothetical protein